MWTWSQRSAKGAQSLYLFPSFPLFAHAYCNAFVAYALAASTMSLSSSTLTLLLARPQNKSGFFLSHMLSFTSLTSTPAPYISRFVQSRVSSKPTFDTTDESPHSLHINHKASTTHAHHHISLINGVVTFPLRVATYGLNFFIRLPAVSSGVIFS